MQNTDQDVLKYQKLYHWAHTLITSGVIKNMDKFPSETSLQKKFGYSRQTVRTALRQLEEEGLITRVRGSGTYVSYEGQLKADRPMKRVRRSDFCSVTILSICFQRFMTALSRHLRRRGTESRSL